MRLALYTTTALAAFAIAAPAMAQEASDETGITDIVVTAQRKEESLQKAAVAIDAVSAASLTNRGITSATDLTKSVPALSIPASGGSIASVFLRGVGNITTSSYNDPAVTPNYDGVVLGRGGGVFGAAFYDLQRVEVLKGPQGILYGRNATGGAINIIPMRPELGKNGVGGSVSYGNFNAWDVNGHANLAVGDTVVLDVIASGCGAGVGTDWRGRGASGPSASAFG